MVFSLVRCLTGLKKPSQDNAEYINSRIVSWPSLITSGATLLGITMNSTLGTMGAVKGCSPVPVVIAGPQQPLRYPAQSAPSGHTLTHKRAATPAEPPGVISTPLACTTTAFAAGDEPHYTVWPPSTTR